MSAVLIRTSSSSSTSRATPRPTRAAGPESASSSLPTGPVLIGSQSSIAVPLPGALSIVSPPPSCAARPWTIDSPKPVPLPDALRREERLDRALARRLIHPHTSVDDTEQHIVSRNQPRGVTSVHALPLCFDGERATFRHGVTRVHRQVQERHLELVGVGLCKRQA